LLECPSAFVNKGIDMDVQLHGTEFIYDLAKVSLFETCCQHVCSQPVLIAGEGCRCSRCGELGDVNN
jgi:hypothetical protein